MIGKVCRRGTDTRRLLGYLFTGGLAGERGLDSAHRDARVIAGYQRPGGLEPERTRNGRADVSRLAALLDAPVRAGGVGKDAKATYHLAISAAPTDRLLSDAQWADIAGQYLDRLGLAEHGDTGAVRWVAVRHADNHVHVVATLVRQDGRRVFPHHDFYRAREASLAVEKQYGLTPTSPVDRTANPEITRASDASTRRRCEPGRRRDCRLRPDRTGRCCGPGSGRRWPVRRAGRSSPTGSDPPGLWSVSVTAPATRGDHRLRRGAPAARNDRPGQRLVRRWEARPRPEPAPAPGPLARRQPGRRSVGRRTRQRLLVGRAAAAAAPGGTGT